MSLRVKLLALFTLTVALCVGLVAGIVSLRVETDFERLEGQRADALVEQFRREFNRRGADVLEQVQGIANSESVQRIALNLTRPGADPSPYVDQAQSLAQAHNLEILDLMSGDGTLISSAEYPARFGYREDWVTRPVDWAAQGAFLRTEETPGGAALALIAVRPVRISDKYLYVAGGKLLNREFLASLVLPAGTRALLYHNTGYPFSSQSVIDSSGPVADAAALEPLIDDVRRQPQELSRTIDWSSGAEVFHAIPLQGPQRDLLGVLLVGSSRRELAQMQGHIRLVALLVGCGGLLLGVLLSGWAATRVTRPVEKLAAAAQEVAAGNWTTHVDVSSQDELGRLADAFNQMTLELIGQRDRLVQAERVAAWRELARRLAHELKNPLFPLQITVENLMRARRQNPAQFEEVFAESTQTLMAELANLKTIIGRFSDFAKMPRPRLQAVRINELVREVGRLFQAQLDGGNGRVRAQLELDDSLGAVEADPDLLRRALENLVLNALDAMPEGGTLTLRTRRRPDGFTLEVGDTGTGLTPEECSRLFTPYYTSKQHGTGLGLAIVQSVVSDHGGRISVESQPRRGTTFRLDLPERPPEIPRDDHAQ